MKKVLFLVIISLFFVSTVKAIEKEKIDGVYYEVLGESEKRTAYYFKTERPVYIYDPSLSTTVDNLADTSLEISTEDLEYITYANNIALKHPDNINYYLAVQSMIFSKLAGKLVYFYNEDGSQISITKEYLDIRKEIEPDLVRPSFHQYTVQGTSDSEFNLVDENKVLANYQVVPSNNLVTIDDNNLKLILKEYGHKQLEFRKIIKEGDTIELWKNNSGQIFIDLGNAVSVTSYIDTFNISPQPRLVNIQIGSKDIPIKKELVLKLKDKSGREMTVSTDNNGRYEGTLSPGNYQLQVVNLPVNFNSKTVNLTVKDESEKQDYYFSFTERRGTLTINRKGNYLTINSKENVLLSGVVFEIYAKEDINNNLLEKYVKDEKIATIETVDGVLNYSLPLGKYYIVEKTIVDYLPYTEVLEVEFNENSRTKSKTINTQHVGFTVKVKNRQSDDELELCFKDNQIDKDNCFKEQNFYSVLYGDYYFNFKRGDKIIKQDFNFTESVDLVFDFDEIFKTKGDLDEKETSNIYENENYTLPKTDDLYGDIRFCCLGLGVLFWLGYYFVHHYKV